jgi:predicted amidohydrolase
MREGIVLVDVDLKEIDKVRKEWPFLKDRRPETYKEIMEGRE